MDQHYRFSTFREKLVEHLFVGELLKLSWLRGECSLEVARPEVDSRGYDLIIERAGIVRHIQLKASAIDAQAATQKVHLGLAHKPSGCVVWIRFDAQTLALGPYLFFGSPPGLPLPDISALKTARHTKPNMDGIKADRPDLRVVPRTRFVELRSAEEVFAALFDATASLTAEELAELERQLGQLVQRRAAEFAVGKPALPVLAQPLPAIHKKHWHPVDGMYGGFSYWFEASDGRARLIVESWSRVVDGSGQRHEISPAGVLLLDEGFV